MLNSTVEVHISDEKRQDIALNELQPPNLFLTTFIHSYFLGLNRKTATKHLMNRHTSGFL
jgi:hypothetical protein